MPIDGAMEHHSDIFSLIVFLGWPMYVTYAKGNPVTLTRRGSPDRPI
jgi:hypothetical protein